jgi:hypothetical protein
MLCHQLTETRPSAPEESLIERFFTMVGREIFPVLVVPCSSRVAKTGWVSVDRQSSLLLLSIQSKIPNKSLRNRGLYLTTILRVVWHSTSRDRCVLLCLTGTLALNFTCIELNLWTFISSRQIPLVLQYLILGSCDDIPILRGQSI